MLVKNQHLLFQWLGYFCLPVPLPDGRTDEAALRRDIHSFIVRIWNEATDQNGVPVTWRGSIDHVGGGERLYFYELDGVIRFIQEQLGIRKKQPISIWQSIFSRIRHALHG